MFWKAVHNCNNGTQNDSPPCSAEPPWRRLVSSRNERNTSKSRRYESNKCADTVRRRLWNIAVNIERYAKVNHINLTFNKRQSFPTKTSLQYQYNGLQWTPIKLPDKEQYTCYAKCSAMTVTSNSADMFGHHVPVQLKALHSSQAWSFIPIT